MKDHRTFGRKIPLFIETFSRSAKSLEEWLESAYECYEGRELNRLPDEYIVEKQSDEVLRAIKTVELTTIELLKPVYTSFIDYDDNSMTDIHIPLIGTMSTLFYCPNKFIHNIPKILAEVHNVEDARKYDPKINWAGTGFTSHSCSQNVIMLLFSDHEIDQIESTLYQLNSVIEKSNRVIRTFEEDWNPKLIQKIEARRQTIIKKRQTLEKLGLQNAKTTEPLKARNIQSYTFDNQFKNIQVFYSDGSQLSEVFSPNQTKALAYMVQEYKLGKQWIPQTEITEAIGSHRPKLREIFRRTENKKTVQHPLFKQLFLHDNRGYYQLFRI
ncbi:MAG: hypothetical protein AB7F28_03950 [Candidatus Margulisiibacteriota bacterium]